MELEDLEMIKENHGDFMVAKKDPSVSFADCPHTRLSINLIKEELRELADAIENDDPKEIRDALVDIRYVLNGAINVMGFSDTHADDFVACHASNQSKQCRNEEVAKLTIQAYETGTHWDKPGVKITDLSYVQNPSGRFIIKKPDGKYLKSLEYTPFEIDR